MNQMNQRNKLQLRRLSISPSCRTHRDTQDGDSRNDGHYAQTDHLKPTKPGRHEVLPPVSTKKGLLPNGSEVTPQGVTSDHPIA